MSQETPKESKPEERQKVDVKVSVDSEQMKLLLEQQRKLEEDKKRLEEEVKKATEEKTKAEAEKKTKEEEAEDYKGKLEIIATKEFEKKRALLLERAKTLIQDEARLKEIEAKLTDPEQLMANEYMINVLEDALKKGEEAHKLALETERKKAEEEAKNGTPPTPAPTGSAPLSPAQLGVQTMGFDSVQAMIADLRVREKSSNPETAALAKAILDEMFRKWANAIKKEYDQMRGFKAEPDEEKKITQPSLKEITKNPRAKKAEQEGA